MSEKTREQLIEEIHTDISMFFLDNPFEETTHELWEWFTGYIYFREDVLSGKEIAASLFFYERLMDTLTHMHGLLTKINGWKAAAPEVAATTTEQEAAKEATAEIVPIHSSYPTVVDIA